MRYVLDAELRSKNAALKPEMLEDSIVNGNKKKNTDIEQKKAKKMPQKLFTKWHSLPST